MYYNNDIQFIKTIKKNPNEYAHWDELDAVYGEYKRRTLKKILTKLEKQFDQNKIVYLRGTYEGGHDEGGWTDYEWQNEDEITVKNPSFSPNYFVDKYEVLKHEDDFKIDLYEYEKTIYDYTLNDDNIYELLSATGAISKYGSFAFEGRATGSTLLNVRTGEYETEGEESMETWDDHSEKGNIYE